MIFCFVTEVTEDTEDTETSDSMDTIFLAMHTKNLGSNSREMVHPFTAEKSVAYISNRSKTIDSKQLIQR